MTPRPFWRSHPRLSPPAAVAVEDDRDGLQHASPVIPACPPAQGILGYALTRHGKDGGPLGPGPHDVHLAPQHVEQLGQLIQLVLPQELPHKSQLLSKTTSTSFRSCRTCAARVS